VEISREELLFVAAMIYALNTGIGVDVCCDMATELILEVNDRVIH
jgi:hypothetical protein